MAIFGRAFYRVNDSVLSVKDMGIWDRILNPMEKLGRFLLMMEVTEEEKAERVAAEAEKRIAEAKRKDM